MSRKHCDLDVQNEALKKVSTRTIAASGEDRKRARIPLLADELRVSSNRRTDSGDRLTLAAACR